MKKIPTLFVRSFTQEISATDVVSSNVEWVLNNEGVATVKHDGTCCLVREGVLYKRYDRKLIKMAKDRGPLFSVADFKPAPDGWEACESEPTAVTGHWPGWRRVGIGPEDQWHREGLVNFDGVPPDGTYELVGPKIQGNPYRMQRHALLRHGAIELPLAPRTFEGLRAYLGMCAIEGIVWHHPDGRMAKIKRSDFGLPWPPSVWHE